MSGHPNGHCWISDNRFYYHRGRDWRWLTLEHIHWILTQHAEGEEDSVIVCEFKNQYGRSINITTVRKVIAEEGLPKFEYSGDRLCKGCGRMICSDPCVLCTVQKSAGILSGAIKRKTEFITP